MLSVVNENGLHMLAKTLSRAGVQFVPIEECDEPYSGALMALGIPPGKKEDLRRHFSSLPLLR